MTPEEFREDLNRKLRQLEAELPQELGEAAREYFFESFDKQGFGGQQWVARKEPTGDWPILVKSGQLKSDVGNASIEASWSETRITVSNDYGAYHNDGTDRLPQREFVGTNEELEEKLTALIEQKLKEVFE